MTPYWVSTPGYTVLVLVDARSGLVRWTAPYARRWMVRQPWATVRESLHQRHGDGLRLVRLEQ